jgi:hypothetical protein
MERVHRVYLSIPSGRFTGLPADSGIPLSAARLMPREPCRDLIELTATSGRAASAIAYYYAIRRRYDGQALGAQFT